MLDNKVVSVLRAQAASVAPAIQKILPTFPSSKVLHSYPGHVLLCSSGLATVVARRFSPWHCNQPPME